MRIPKLLIKLLSPVKNTRVWRYRWRILAFSPFILALGIFAFYTIYRTLAEKQYSDFITSWEAKGETLDVDTLYPPPGDEEDDFFLHPDVLSELNRTHTTKLERINRLGIIGITENSGHYSSADGKGTYAMGIPVDIRLWLEPPILTQPEQQAAEKCLQLIEPFNSRLDALVKASHRPEAFYSSGFDANGNISSFTPNLSPFELMRAYKLLSDRVILQLAVGKEKGAAQDIMCLFRISNHFQDGHSLIGYLIGAASIQSLERPLWEGLKRHGWRDASLAEFDKLLAKMDEHKRFLRCMRQEMVYTNAILKSIHDDPNFLDKQFKGLSPTSSSTTTKTWKERGQELLKSIKPRGWDLKHGTMQLAIIEEELFYPNGNKCSKLSITQLRKLESIPNPMHGSVFDSLTIGNETMDLYARQIGKALKTQASIHNMRTAIAIERYRLQHGNYPASLNDLVPAYLPNVLEDVITKKPLNYTIKSDGTPLIYSIGQNKIDDLGHPHRHVEKGDWAWMYTPPLGFTYDDYKKR